MTRTMAMTGMVATNRTVTVTRTMSILTEPASLRLLGAMKLW